MEVAPRQGTTRFWHARSLGRLHDHTKWTMYCYFSTGGQTAMVGPGIVTTLPKPVQDTICRAPAEMHLILHERRKDFDSCFFLRFKGIS